MLLYVVGEVIMKKMLLLIALFVFMLIINIDVKALTCEYNKDSKGMTIRLSKASGNDYGWQLDLGDSSYSNYTIIYANGSNIANMSSCPSVIHYGCDTTYARCTISDKSSDIYLNGIRGSLTLKGSSNVGGGSTSNNNTKPNYGLGIFGYCDENGCTGTATCQSIFGKADDPNSIFGFMRKYIFIPIRWLTPIILIVLTSLDFAKAIFVDEKEGMGKAKGNFVKRAVAALIIFLAPTIVSILLTLVDGANISNCLNANDIGNL